MRIKKHMGKSREGLRDLVLFGLGQGDTLLLLGLQPKRKVNRLLLDFSDPEGFTPTSDS